MECEKCSCEIKQSEKQYDPFSNSPRRGGCARCKYAREVYDGIHCGPCIAAETATDKFPGFVRAKIWAP